MIKKVILILLSLLISISAAACGKKATEISTTSNPKTDSIMDAYTPYKDAISFTKGTTVLAAGGLPSGDDYGNNVFTRYLEKTQNIKTEIAWSVDSSTYNSKIALCIASHDIPDVLVVNRSTFKQLVDNDLLCDLTKVYSQCISPFLKKQLDGYGEKLFAEVTVNGKMMGVPSPSLNNCQNVLWIRKDWLQKSGLSEPKTIDDVEKLARTFIQRKFGGDNTIGITTTSSLYAGYNSSWGLDTIFSVFGAYPGVWMQKNDKVVYGSTQPEMKSALKKIGDWYKEGILDREFAVRDEASRQSLIGSGKCGMYFGVWWPSNGVADVVELDQNADWLAVSAPVDNEGNLKSPENDPIQSIVVVSKKYEHPEAMIKALNAGYDVLRNNIENPYASQTTEAYNYFFETSPQGWGVMPIPIEINYADCVGRVATDLEAAVKAEDPSLLSITGFQGSYNYILYNRQHPKENRVYYHEELARIVGAKAAASTNLKLIPTCFYGTTRTKSTLWSSLQKMENEMMLKIVMGENTVDTFDQFVPKWKSAGGDQIIKEIEEELKKK